MVKQCNYLKDMYKYVAQLKKTNKNKHMICYIRIVMNGIGYLEYHIVI